MSFGKSGASPLPIFSYASGVPQWHLRQENNPLQVSTISSFLYWFDNLLSPFFFPFLQVASGMKMSVKAIWFMFNERWSWWLVLLVTGFLKMMKKEELLLCGREKYREMVLLLVLMVSNALFVFAFQKCFWKNLNFILFFSLLQINFFLFF